MRTAHARGRRAGLKGWGGVAAMAVVCALTAVLALLLPLTRPSGGGAGTGGQGVAHGSEVRAEDDPCQDPRIEKAPEKQTLSPSGADGGTIEKIKAREGEKRKLIVGVDQNSYRWGYRDPNNDEAGNTLEGFDIDLAHRIAKEILGDPDAVQFKAIPTNQRIPAIQSGRVDMVVRTMTINCTRMADVAFSAPYFKTGQQVLAPKSAPITGPDDTLADKKVCTAAGSTANTELTERQKAGTLPRSTDITSTVVPNQLDCLVRLQLGEVDAVVTDGALAASQAAQDPTVELKGDAPFTTEYYGVAMKLDADDLVRRVNQILVDYRKDTAGGWQASYDTWLSATLGTDSAKSEPPAPEYLRKS
ncbi:MULTISPECIES: transporter substrate-binding domain-containing protein [unclassified Streptomyces]|uniref:glutamate ABC transporter substrate-binding protein n=1 Tax=unclassified Streptomyces TaxID=2593676 RepID=UPI0036ECBC4E